MESLRVLLIDDNATFLRIAARYLQDMGASRLKVVGMAGSGEEALVRASELRPDLVTLDLGMPGISGLELIPRLRKMLPGLIIIVLTLLDTSSYRCAALAAGADAFVAKSVMEFELPSIVDRLLQGERNLSKPQDAAQSCPNPIKL